MRSIRHTTASTLAAALTIGLAAPQAPAHPRASDAAPPIASTQDPGAPDADRGTARIDTLALESHMRFLADDLLEGRGPASRGERIAALYLVAQMRRIGLEPIPGHDYRLPVPLTAVHVDETEAVARISRGEPDDARDDAEHAGVGNAADDDGTQVVRPPAFYHPGGSRAAFRDFAGEMILAGASSGAGEALAEVDLAGKVVVLTPPWSGVTEVERELLQRGAAGSIQLIPDGTFYDRLRIVRGPTRFLLPDAVDDPANQSRLPRVIGGPELIRALGLTDEATPGRSVERARPLGRRFTLELPHTTESRTGYNVAGYVRGADPELRDEWILYVAHYDHVGYGEPTDGDSIWNGFIDNAAGSSMLLEIARTMAADPPPRSVAFVWVTAEEQGLLGSNWFTHDPPIPFDRVRAAINLDGGAPPAPPVSWGLSGAEDSPVGAIAREVIERRGWPVNTVAIGPQSDHWSFHRAGVPSFILFPGSELEGLSEDEARTLTERWHHPHTPADEWHPDFPFAGLGRYADLALEIGRTLARDVEAQPALDRRRP